MPRHNSVPTTCTASLLTDWSFAHQLEGPEKNVLRNIKAILQSLIRDGYKLDFAILHAFTTHEQTKSEKMKEFMNRIGFKVVFEGKKKGDTKRHKETGTIYLWACTPEEYKAGLDSYLKEVTDRLDIIDPPKKPDPERQKLPEIKIRLLAKAGIIPENTHPNDIIESLLKATGCSMKKAETHIKMNYGFNPRVFKGRGDTWVRMSYLQLKRMQEEWKAELV